MLPWRVHRELELISAQLDLVEYGIELLQREAEVLRALVLSGTGSTDENVGPRP